MLLDDLMKIIHYRNMLHLVNENKNGIERPLWELLNSEDILGKLFECCKCEKPLSDVVKPLFKDHFGNHLQRSKGKYWLSRLVWAIMERNGYEMVSEGGKIAPLGKYVRSDRAEEIKKKFDDAISKEEGKD